MYEPAAELPPTLPAGAHLLLRKRFRWLAGSVLVLIVMAIVAACLLPFGNKFEYIILGCGIIAILDIILIIASFQVWFDVRREMNAILRGESLARWRCSESDWQKMDPRWQPGEPLGEVCIMPYSVYAGSDPRHLFFVAWRGGRHLAQIELDPVSPGVLRMEVSVPGSARVPRSRVPIVIPIPPEQREQVEAAVKFLRDSDAVEPGESVMNVVLVIYSVIAFVSIICKKMGFF